MKHIITGIHKESIFKPEDVIGKKALEPFDTFGCHEGYQSCYFLYEKNNEVRFLAHAKIKEVIK